MPRLHRVDQRVVLSVVFVVVAGVLAGCQPASPTDAEPGAAVQGGGDVIAGAATVRGGYPAPDAPSSTDADAASGYPAPDPAGTAAAALATVEHLPSTLQGVIARRDVDGLAGLMGRTFLTVHVPGGGSDTSYSDQAASALIAAAGASIRFEDPPASMPSVEDALYGLVDPEHEVLGVYYTTGWGEEGRGEILFVSMTDPSGAGFLPAGLYAPEGFEAAVTSGLPDRRTAAFSLGKGDRVVEGSLDVPSSWHVSMTGRAAELTSYGPWAWAVDETWPPGGLPPGETSISVLQESRVATIDDAIASVRYFDQEPLNITEQAVALQSGHDATLAVFRFDTVVSTKLFVETSNGLLTAHCDGDAAPCADVLGSLRLVE